MTYKEWEKRLIKYLKPLQKEERTAAVEYYREMYGDKLDSGTPHEEIIQEFGSPSVCAERILSETGLSKPQSKKVNGKKSVGWWIGIGFFTVLVLIPVYATWFAVAVSFGAVCVSGAASALAGIVYTIASPFMAADGVGFFAILSLAGMGLAAIGVGCLLFVGFLYVSKYAFKWLVKSICYVYTRW